MEDNKLYRNLQRKLWMKMVHKDLKLAKNDDEMTKVLDHMIHFVLANKFQLWSSYIYDIPIVHLKHYVVEKIKLKHGEFIQQKMWNHCVRKKCGILLRIIRAFVNSSNFKLCNPSATMKKNILHLKTSQIEDISSNIEKGSCVHSKKSNDNEDKSGVKDKDDDKSNESNPAIPNNYYEGGKEHEMMTHVEIVQQELMHARTMETALSAAKEISEMAISKASEEMRAGQ